MSCFLGGGNSAKMIEEQNMLEGKNIKKRGVCA